MAVANLRNLRRRTSIDCGFLSFVVLQDQAQRDERSSKWQRSKQSHKHSASETRRAYASGSSASSPTNKNAAAPGGVQRNDRIDSACLKSIGATCPATAAPKPATAPISATIVSPRARLRRTSDPMIVESHFDRATPKSIAGIAAISARGEIACSRVRRRCRSRAPRAQRTPNAVLSAR